LATRFNAQGVRFYSESRRRVRSLSHATSHGQVFRQSQLETTCQSETGSARAGWLVTGSAASEHLQIGPFRQSLYLILFNMPAYSYRNLRVSDICHTTVIMSICDTFDYSPGTSAQAIQCTKNYDELRNNARSTGHNHRHDKPPIRVIIRVTGSGAQAVAAFRVSQSRSR
jgi:hypothetical protein